MRMSKIDYTNAKLPNLNDIKLYGDEMEYDFYDHYKKQQYNSSYEGNMKLIIDGVKERTSSYREFIYRMGSLWDTVDRCSKAEFMNLVESLVRREYNNSYYTRSKFPSEYESNFVLGQDEDGYYISDDKKSMEWYDTLDGVRKFFKAKAVNGDEITVLWEGDGEPPYIDGVTMDEG